jgi:hypothetical protein
LPFPRLAISTACHFHGLPFPPRGHFHGLPFFGRWFGWASLLVRLVQLARQLQNMGMWHVPVRWPCSLWQRRLCYVVFLGEIVRGGFVSWCCLDSALRWSPAVR